jgi:glycosyltransferase involved in cell wall biosynthesis
MNFTNVITFPNCREIHKSIKPRKTFACQPIKLLYFSKICKEKGVPQLIDMAKQLNDNDIKFTLDFYGAIDYCYKKEFDLECLRVSNVRYMGVFDVYKHNVYTKLNEYDLLLFPSIWLGEGVAGILVESKIAGIPAVVSNHNVNSEVVIDGQEGIIINGDLAKGFAESVQKLSLDREELFRLANGAFISRKRYDINLYKSSFRE